MDRNRIETIPSRLLLLGPASVSLIVFTQGVTDPVNVTKFFLLGGVAFSFVLAVSTKATLKSLWHSHKLVFVTLLAFLTAALNSLFQSDAPFSQSLYGAYGRNNGFLLYLFLVLCFFAILTSGSPEAFKNIVNSLIIVGFLNVIYCLWVIYFGDFVGWNNPYGNILGTFGNPNFVGAFLGMFSSVLISILIHFRRAKRIFALSFLTLIFCLFEIYKSNAIQGRVLFIAGCGINLALFLWFERKNLWILGTALLGMLSSGILGILGALQIGPLSSLIYKDSVSLRGEYWYAGFQMGKQNLLHGVGFDAYGDWYRFFRRSSSLVRPGIETVSNTAHNVYLDIFAFGGAPLVISYIVLNCFVLISILRVVRRRGDFDYIFVSLTGAWICYQLQSVISINQIGLAVWGWILGAALIAYDKAIPNTNTETVKTVRKRHSQAIITPSLRAGVGFVIGLLVAVPPLSADMKWRASQMTRDASQVEASLKANYMNPISSFRLINTVGVFHDSGLDALAHKYSQEAVRFNPNSFDLWRAVTYIKESTPEERKLAQNRMRTLDPLNPNLTLEP